MCGRGEIEDGRLCGKGGQEVDRAQGVCPNWVPLTTHAQVQVPSAERDARVMQVHMSIAEGGAAGGLVDLVLLRAYLQAYRVRLPGEV